VEYIKKCFALLGTAFVGGVAALFFAPSNKIIEPLWLSINPKDQNQAVLTIPFSGDVYVQFNMQGKGPDANNGVTTGEMLSFSNLKVVLNGEGQNYCGIESGIGYDFGDHVVAKIGCGMIPVTRGQKLHIGLAVSGADRPIDVMVRYYFVNTCIFNVCL
jgi:hypothetical protein